MTKKKILQAKENEIAKAGKMMFDAFFGEEGALEKSLNEDMADSERDSTARGTWVDVETTGHSLLRCDACGRELVMLGTVNVAIAERHGWRSTDGVWRCTQCAVK